MAVCNRCNQKYNTYSNCKNCQSRGAFPKRVRPSKLWCAIPVLEND
jgi:hypothetical protein